MLIFKMKVKFVLCLLFGLFNAKIFSQTQHQECGKRLGFRALDRIYKYMRHENVDQSARKLLPTVVPQFELFVRHALVTGPFLAEKGAIICWLLSEEENAKPFDFKLCTHAIVYAGWVRCGDNKCNFRNFTGFEERVKWALPHFRGKLGTMAYINPSIEKYLLRSKLRRSNTVNDLLKFFEYKGLSFLWLVGEEDNFESTRPLPVDDVNFLLFVEELARKFHARGFHIGLRLDYKDVEEISPSDSSLQTLSQYVDWYTFMPRNNVSTSFMEPWTPLKTQFEGTKRTYEYWIEKLLRLISSECLVIYVGPTYSRYTSEDKFVDPGPGSIIEEYGVYHGADLSSMCNTIDSRPDCREYWDEDSSTPWAVCGDDFYTYDNPRSLRLKVDFIKRYNIAGLHFTTGSISPDNICNGDAFANLKAIQEFRHS